MAKVEEDSWRLTAMTSTTVSSISTTAGTTSSATVPVGEGLMPGDCGRRTFSEYTRRVMRLKIYASGSLP